MRRLGFVLVLIVSFVLPSFGSTAFGMSAEPCPMQGAMADMEHAGIEAPCCEDMENASSPGSKSPCKSGQECKTSALLQTELIKPFVPQHAFPQTALIQPLLQRGPAGLWRPPRAS